MSFVELGACRDLDPADLHPDPDDPLAVDRARRVCARCAAVRNQSRDAADGPGFAPLVPNAARSVMTELWRMSATELGHAIRTGQLSSRDAVEAHLRRIETVNPSINAVTALLAERATPAPM